MTIVRTYLCGGFSLPKNKLHKNKPAKTGPKKQLTKVGKHNKLQAIASKGFYYL